MTLMTLGTLIRLLETLPPDRVCPVGLHKPHSWRGIYSSLAFEPGPPMPVRQILNAARQCVGREFVGWKGGNYLMDLDTDVYVSTRGKSYGWGSGLSPLALALIVGDLAILDDPELD
jgi:hypothetical protein